jgi:hypothetical protein
MNLIYTLALVTQTGLTDLAQFQDRDVCIKQALLLKEQAVKAVCVPKTQHTDKEIQKEIDKAMGLMRYMMAQMKEGQ